MGRFWPTPAFAAFADGYFEGKHGFPSWGNGAVMSFAPDPILGGRWQSETEKRAPQELCDAAGVLSKSHTEHGAVLGATLLRELLGEIYAGRVKSSEDIRATVLSLPVLSELVKYQYEHECYPIAAFREWLEKGDCDL